MKDKKLLISIVSIFTIISIFIGASLAYFVPIVIGNDTASNHNTKAGILRLTYNGTNVLNLNNASPGDSASTTFTVTNSGTLPINNYEIYFSKLTNEFINDEVVYTLTCLSSDTNPCLGKEQNPVPTTEELSLTQGSIASGTTHTYTLSVTFINKDEPQNYNQGKELKFTMTINEMEQGPAVLIARGFIDGEGPAMTHFWEYAGDITEITFENQIDVPANAFKSWDVSESQDGKIMAYIIDDGLGTDTYRLYIQSNGILNANPNMKYWFAFSKYNSSTDLYESKLTNIINLQLLNTSNVINMQGMFAGCSSLTSLDLSNFSTSKATNMSAMFYDCSSLTSLDLNNFNTSSVTSMSDMFSWCSSLTSLNLSNFNTSSVTNMSLMFEGCSSLTSLDLSNSIINNSIERCNIFYNCKSDLNIIVNDSNSKTLYDYWLNNNDSCAMQ